MTADDVAVHAAVLGPRLHAAAAPRAPGSRLADRAADDHLRRRRAPLSGPGALPRCWRRSGPGDSGGETAIGAWLLLGPILATFGAAALQVYPVRAAPGALPLPGVPRPRRRPGPEALGTVAGARASAARPLVATVACAALALLGLVRNPPPFAPEPLKPVLETMRQAWQPGDRAYVYYGGEKAFLYYARRYGFAPGDYVLGPLRPGGPAPLPARARRRSGARPASGWS